MNPRFFCLIVLSFLLACTDQSKPKSGESAVKGPLEELSRQIKEHPGDAELFFQRSSEYRKLKNDSLALADLYKAISLDSGKSYYFSSIADILFEHKDINGSVQWIQKAIARNPEDAQAHLKIARLFLFTGEYPKAFNSINTVLRSDVYNAEAYFLKGMCYKNMGDTNKSIGSFQTAVQTNPDYKDAHMQLALIYSARKNALALRYFENAYSCDSSDLEPLYGAAMFWQNQEKFDEAKKVFRRIILINPQYEKSYYNTGWMLLQEDSVEKALRHFAMAIQVKQDYTEAWYNRGLCYEILGKADSARNDYQQALVFYPEFIPAQKSLQRIKK
ncbi:MAG TPA: tetratricopeptide repeat protein [Chitinophagaceae bacterium]|nr:tetratricopeptide repeat protein [Chitinophagaceae bacterium]